MSETPIPAPLRWEVWARDDFRCLCCGSRMFLVIDHVLPEAHGGQTVASNLQTLCQPCNSRKRDHITDYIRPGERCLSVMCWCVIAQIDGATTELERFADERSADDPLPPDLDRALARHAGIVERLRGGGA